MVLLIASPLSPATMCHDRCHEQQMRTIALMVARMALLASQLRAGAPCRPKHQIKSKDDHILLMAMAMATGCTCNGSSMVTNLCNDVECLAGKNLAISASSGPGHQRQPPLCACPELQISANDCTCASRVRGQFWQTNSRPYPVGHSVVAGVYALQLAELLSHRQMSEVAFN